MLSPAPTPGRPPPPVARRDGGDRCPGAIRLHAADDGHLARVRVPGGRMTADQVRFFACAATDLGDGQVHVTSRGNLQLRGLAPDAGRALAERLHAAGLLPSLAHDRTRNVVASPLAGLDGRGHGDIDPVLRDLDRLLCGVADFTSLSGRFLFAVDDGRGDVLGLGPDLAVVAEHAEGAEGAGTMRLWVGGRPTALTASAPAAAGLLGGAALAFLSVRDEVAPHAWQVADLGEAAGRIAPMAADIPAPQPNSPPAPHLGVVSRAGGPTGVSVGLPLGSAPATAWQVIAEVAQAARLPGSVPVVRTTPWRGAVVAGVAPDDADAALRALTAAGLLTRDADPLAGVTACTGRPGCASARSDVRRDALSALQAGRPAYPLYLAGCARRCGHPAGPHLEATATAENRYTVSLVEDAHSAETILSAVALTDARLTDLPRS